MSAIFKDLAVPQNIGDFIASRDEVIRCLKLGWDWFSMAEDAMNGVMNISALPYDAIPRVHLSRAIQEVDSRWPTVGKRTAGN
jgi:hypothetical protein